MLKITLEVEGMRCGMCETHVGGVVRRVEGVKNIAEGCGLGLCTGCFTGKYPAETPAVTEKSKFESKIPEATE